MTPQLQLLQNAGGQPGELGFKLTGRAKDGSSLIRVWLRRSETWSRALNPRILSQEWDVRVFSRTDSSFTLLGDFQLSELDGLAESFDFPSSGAALSSLSLNGDPIHDRVLVWAKRVTGAEVQQEPSTYQPQRLTVRYTPSSAKSFVGARMPLGRPVPPSRPMEPFNPNMVRPVTVRESVGEASAKAIAPAAPSVSAIAVPDATPAEAVASVASKAPSAAPSSPATRPMPSVPGLPPRRPLTSRLAAIREEVEKEGE